MAVQTAREQLMLELVNQARLDPLAEAARLGIDLNEGLAPGTLNGDAKAPLAMNALLIDSSLDHSQWMINNDTFSHTGSGGSDAGQRMTSAGYNFTGSWTWGENIAWQGTTGTPDLTTYIYDQHDGLFLSSGHRTNILGDAFRELGIGQIAGTFTYQGTPYNASMITQNFAKTGSNYFITGVAFDDGDGNNFYSVGEARSGMTMTTSAGAVTSNSAGGYSQSVAAGTYDVTFSGGGLVGTKTVTVNVATENVKLDVVDGTTIWSSASLTLGAGATAVKLLGVANLNVTGSNAGENIIGNKGNNVLDGGNGTNTIEAGAGNDTLIGGIHADNLSGGTGDDTLKGGIGNDIIDGGDGVDLGDYSNFGGKVVVNLNVAVQQDTLAGGLDTITNVENLLGGIGNDRFIGTIQQSTLTGGSGSDFLIGLGGDDVLNGGIGNDNLLGGSNNDILTGGSGRDVLLGGDGIDILDGGSEKDLLRGGNGGDTLTGGGGRDVLIGGDFISGTFPGDGAGDTFVFNDVTDSSLGGGTRDIIRDFEQSLDIIDLGNIDAITGGGDDAFTFIGSTAFSGNAGELRSFVTGGGHTSVRGDVDGDGVADLDIFLNGAHTMVAGDFVL